MYHTTTYTNAIHIYSLPVFYYAILSLLLRKDKTNGQQDIVMFCVIFCVQWRNDFGFGGGWWWDGGQEKDALALWRTEDLIVVWR